MSSMQKIIDYEVLSDDLIWGLVKKVNYALKTDWECLGGAIPTETGYIQTVVRYEEENQEDPLHKRKSI